MIHSLSEIQFMKRTGVPYITLGGFNTSSLDFHDLFFNKFVLLDVENYYNECIKRLNEKGQAFFKYGLQLDENDIKNVSMRICERGQNHIIEVFWKK